MILKAYMRFYNLLKKTRPKSSYCFYDIGFHGDMFLIALIETIANNGIEYFVETGTNVVLIILKKPLSIIRWLVGVLLNLVMRRN